MSDCVFCRILADQLPASFLYRDREVAAFMDIRPVNPGHLLVVPTAHATGLADLDPATGAALLPLAQRLAAALYRSGLRCEGVSLVLADGRAAGQEVFHVHLHVIPRFQGDGFGFRRPPAFDQPPPDRATLDGVAAGLRAALGAGEGPAS